MEISPGGDVIVMDPNQHVVHVYNNRGRAWRTWGWQTAGVDFGLPTSFAMVDAKLFVLEGRCVQVFE